MGLAIDTIGLHVTNPGATGAAPVLASGDILTVRSFPATSTAKLEQITRQGATSGFIQVKSTRFHDDVRGIRYTPATTPSRMLLPPDVGQALYSGDTLTVLMAGGTAESDAAALHLYYSTLQGTAARLHMWGDIAGGIANIKPVEVTVKTAAIGAWATVVLTNTENLLHAGSTYAVLGYVVNAAGCVVGVKGQETGNMRVCGPATTDTDVTSNYFVDASTYHGTPHIPVLKATNRGSIFATLLADAATVTVEVQLILAELTTSLAS